MANKALIVGINDYADCPLSGCAKDAESMAKMLARNSDGSKNFDVATLLNVSKRADLRNAIRKLFETGEGDIALFYFSGHGCVAGHDGYIVTPDCEDGDEGISLAEILKSANMANAQYKNRVIILDCCNAGRICGCQPNSSDAPNIASGVTLLAACGPAEYAQETNLGGDFTSLVVYGLAGAAADICGVVTPSSIYACVDRFFGAWQQRPVFATNVKARVALRRTEPPIAPEILRRIGEYFRSEDHYHLDPSYEFTNDPNEKHEYVKPYADQAHVKILKDLQKMERVGLVVPCGQEHMYFATMKSMGCKLTAAGRYIHDLAINDRL